MIAWSRFIHEGVSSAEGSVVPSLVCVGKDLTDRLMDADNAGQPEVEERGVEMGGIEGEFVTPLAVSPPVPPSGEGHVGAVEKVHEFLAGLEGRVGAIVEAGTGVVLGGVDVLRTLGGRGDAVWAGRMEALRQEAARGQVEAVREMIRQVGGLCGGEGHAKA